MSDFFLSGWASALSSVGIEALAWRLDVDCVELLLMFWCAVIFLVDCPKLLSRRPQGQAPAHHCL
ncbi:MULTISPECIES: hypothetical protein [Synechococcales]|uniref:hypothetical protein n=1 Tax=Synechococcus sp. CS-1333 TaxID=2848638 RepID=UPI00223C01D2|nr:hypothetical protein [Synechococcus sp. CS-1333]MCT0209449.1 hypothetical protein [Synechococcus sp. CS-1333]